MIQQATNPFSSEMYLKQYKNSEYIKWIFIKRRLLAI